MKLFITFLILVGAAFGQGTSLTPGTWTAINYHGAPMEVVGYDTTSYVAALHAHCVWGAYHQSISSEPNDALVCYSYRENRSFILAVGSMMHDERHGSLGHAVGDQIYVPEKNSLYYTSDGSTSTGIDHFLGRWVQFDAPGLAQRDVTAAGTGQLPWITYSGIFSCMAYDSTNHKALVFPNYLGKASFWDETTNLWASTSNTNIPTTPTNFPTCEFNADNGLLYVYGGGTAGMWTYNAATDTWAAVTTTCTGTDCSGAAPAAREGAFLAYSTVDHVFLMGGGGTGPNTGAFTDTWTFNPTTFAWTELSPASSYAVGAANLTWERCLFHPDSNTFVLLTGSGGGSADGTWTSYPVQPYAFALSGSAGSVLNYGRVTNTYTPSANSLNVVSPTATSNGSVGSQSYGAEPSIATDGTNTYLGWAETGNYFDTSACGVNMSGYAKSNSGSSTTWTALGSGTCPLNPNNNWSGSHTQLAVVGSTLWDAHVEDINSGGGHYPWATAYSLSGTTWSGGQIGCFSAACNGNIEQFVGKMISVAGVPTAALMETSHAVDPPAGYLYIVQYISGSWSVVGAAAINNSTAAGNRVVGATVTADGSGNIYACWDESVNSARYTISTTAQEFCKEWNGSAWSSELGGGSLNVTSASWGGSPSCVWLSQLYCAWTERPTNSNPLLYVRTWNGSAWSSIGSNLNQSTAGWAVNPKLATDGTHLWLAWEEQAALSRHSLGYALQWSGSAWSYLGGPIASDVINGSIEGIDAVVVGSALTVAFSEMSLGNLRQIHALQWNGTSWAILPSSSAAAMDSGTGAPSNSVGNNGDLYHRTDVPSIYGPKIGGAWPSTFSYIVGKGCTTVYHIDNDCDGYGVGPTVITNDPNPLFGVDADDADATANTPASVIAKYTTISAFLTHLGYPTSRIFYIDPVNGVDTSGCGTVTSPCQHFSYSAIGTTLNDGAGGTVLYRASTSAGLQICTGGPCYYPHASSGASPVVVMAYPGELVTFLAANAPLNGGGGSYNASTNLIFRGFSLVSSSLGNGYGIEGSWLQNVTAQNNELAGWSMAIQYAAGSQNSLVTQNLFHDINEHAIYPVTGDQSQGVYSTGLFNCAGATWQANNTSYNPHFNFVTSNNVMLFVGSGGFDAIHYNGQICGGTITGNILVGGGGTGIGLQDGNQNVAVSNNLIAGNSSSQILLYIYGCENGGGAIASGQIGVSCDSTYTGSVGLVEYPNMETNNVIVNNTIWSGVNAPSSYFCGPSQCQTPTYGIQVSNPVEGLPGGRYVKYTTLQNNLLVTFDGSGGGTYPQLWFDRNSYPETNTLANNLLWNAYTGNGSAHAMNITSNSLSCSSAPWYCAGSTSGTYGSGSASPGMYSFSGFQSYNTGSNTNELWGNPTFVDVQTSYSTTPNMFNFRLQPGSPAIAAGLASGAPSTDITGTTRATIPSIGAYDAGSTSIGGSSTGGAVTTGGGVTKQIYLK